MLKQIALAATGLVLIGIGGMVVTASIQHENGLQSVLSAMHGQVENTAGQATQNFDQSKTLNGTSVQSLVITAEAASVHIHPSSSNQLTVHAYGTLIGINPNDFIFDVTQSGNQVTISLHKRSPLLSVGFNSVHLNVDVQVPQHLYNTLSAQSLAGSLTIEDLKAGSFTLHSNAGSVNASNLTGSVQAGSNAGSVTLTNVKGDVNMQSNAGSVNAIGVNGNIEAQSSAGSVNLKLQNITHNISARSSAGRVVITTAQVPAALQFTIQTTAGSINFRLPNANFTVNKSSDVEGSIGQGGPLLDLQASAGSVDVSQGPVG